MDKNINNPFQSIKLISMNKYFNEMVQLHDTESFPKVLLLSGKKGIGKFTLVFHFLNYIFSKKDNFNYNTEDKIIDVNSNFYNSIINQNCADVIFLQAIEGKNIKIDDVRNLKSTLSSSSLSTNPRFIIIDEVEFLNTNSVNALLKTLEEPSKNNFFILINNQQADLIATISSRCLQNKIYLNLNDRNKIVDHLIENRKISLLINDDGILTPGLLLAYNELFVKYKIFPEDDIFLKVHKLLNAFKKDKDKTLIGLTVFLVDQFFYKLIKKNNNRIDFLLHLKLSIVYKINDFIVYNLNINSVLKSIEFKLKNV
jgi:DNA polymerase-3 subunit delta'